MHRNTRTHRHNDLWGSSKYLRWSLSILVEHINLSRVCSGTPEERDMTQQLLAWWFIPRIGQRGWNLLKTSVICEKAFWAGISCVRSLSEWSHYLVTCIYGKALRIGILYDFGICGDGFLSRDLICGNVYLFWWSILVWVEFINFSGVCFGTPEEGDMAQQ